jgi:hypothetical protein
VNKELYNSTNGVVEFPEDKREHMRLCFHSVKGADDSVDGFKRNKELQSQQTIDYKQLKRIKNFFDSFKGNQNEPSFILNGGVEIKNWVNDQLRRMRDGIHMTKKHKSETGLQNQFIKNHEKKDFTNVRKSQEHTNTVSKYDVAVTEALKRINEIISKI